MKSECLQKHANTRMLQTLLFINRVPDELMNYLKKNKNELVPEFVALWE